MRLRRPNSQSTAAGNLGYSSQMWPFVVVAAITIGNFLVDRDSIASFKDFAQDTQKKFNTADTIASFKNFAQDTHKSLQAVFGLTTSSTNKRQATVCWMGVADDWPSFAESTVMEHVLAPLADAGYELSVFLLAQNTTQDLFPPFREPYSFLHEVKYNESIYMNTNPSIPLSARTQGMYMDPGDWWSSWKKVPIPSVASDASPDVKKFARLLDRWFTQTFNITSAVHVHTYQPLMNPPVPPEYFKAMISRDAFRAPDKNGNRHVNFYAVVRAAWRVVNHIRHLHAQSVCGKLAAAQQTPMGKGSLLVQVGEDAKMEQIIPVSSIEKLEPKQLLVVPCPTRRGLEHDQIEILRQDDSDIVHDALAHPYQGIQQYGIFGNDASNVTTLADYLQMVYASLGIEILTPNPSVPTNASDSPFSAVVTKPTPSSWDPSTVPLVPYPISDANYINHTHPPTVPIMDSNSSKSALICVTGQLQRMELENKFETLLRPMSEEGGYEKIDLVIVVARGTPLFQLKKDPGKKNSISVFAEESDLRTFLNSSRTSFLSNITVKISDTPKLPMNPQYLVLNVKAAYFGQMYAHRADNGNYIPEGSFFGLFERNTMANMNMMEAYRHCISDQDKSYDLYVRVRDDVGFPNGRISPDLYNASILPPGGFLTHWDRNNGGINDRMAFVNGRDTALCYFHLPFVNMFNGKRIDDISLNTEIYFKRLYWRAGCPSAMIHDHGKYLLPVKFHQGRMVR